MVTDLPEKPATVPTRVVNVHVMILPTDRLFDKWLMENLAVDNDGVTVLTQRDFWCHLKAPLTRYQSVSS